MALNIHQIYFNEKTKAACKEGWTHYNNAGKLTEFFENEVIRELIQNGELNRAEYFGVFSWDVMDSVYFKEYGLPFNPANLETVIGKHNEEQKVDVFSFFKRRRQENIVTQADSFHKGYLDMMDKILEELGMVLPQKITKVVLFNLMVANSKFWNEYCDKMLFPAMDLMVDMPELYEDSGYALLGKKRIDPDVFMRAFDKPYYPYHPFLCERFAAIFLELNPQFVFKQIF